TVARSAPAIRWIDGVKAPELPGLDRSQRNLVGRVPVRRVGHCGERDPVLVVSVCVAKNSIQLSQLLWIGPRTVALADFQHAQKIAALHGLIAAEQPSAVAVGARSKLGQSGRQRTLQMHMRG